MNGSASSQIHRSSFATTRWTMVSAASNRHLPESRQALTELCQSYWFPLYAYVRRKGYVKEDAEDLTQSFFVKLLEKDMFAELRAEHGRFRAFLLASLKHFLLNEWDKSQTQKRGGQATHLSLDWQNTDEQYSLQVASDNESPENIYDREWALSLLRTVLVQLERDYDKHAQPGFELLKPYLTMESDSVSYIELAQSSGLQPGHVRVIIHRLRKRYRQLLREAIAQTLVDPTQTEDELNSLLAAFKPGS